MHIVHRCLLLAVVALSAGFPTLATASPQATITGAVTGTVTDTNGAVVPHASVGAINLATNTILSTTTDTNGRYKLDNARPGRYTIQVTASGFSPYEQKNLMVEASRLTTVNITLPIPGQSLPVVAAPKPNLSASVVSVPRVNSPPAIDCSEGGWDHAAKIEISQTNGTLVRLFPSPPAELSSPPQEVRDKLNGYRATYELEWDATHLYVRVEIDERQIDNGHPTYSQENALKTGGANLFLPDALYDTVVLQLLGPSLERYVTEMHVYVRPPGARAPEWTFAGRDNNEEDFHLLEGKAVSCPRPGGYLVKAAVAWLPFPPDWLPAPGAKAGLRLFVPLPYDQRLSLEDRSRKVFALVRLAQITLQE